MCALFLKWAQRRVLQEDIPVTQAGSGSALPWFPSPFPLLAPGQGGLTPLQVAGGVGVGLGQVSVLQGGLLLPQQLPPHPSQDVWGGGLGPGQAPAWMSGSGLSQADEQVLLEHLGSSVRASTRKTYSGYWRRFREFCELRNVSFLPASSAVVARFLIYISEANASVCGAKIAVSAISYFHKIFMGDAVSPTESVIVKNVMRSLSEKFAKPVKKANPFSSLLLKDLFEYYSGLSLKSKSDDCLVVMISVMFCLMARFEEVSKLTTDCIKVLDSGDVEVTFPSAKNYNFSNSKKSFIAFCPNAKFNVAKIFTEFVNSLLPGSLLFSFTYASALSKVRNLLERANISVDEASSFSLHSFRVGAVSEAVNGGLISDSDVQRHARWNSIEMLYRYRCQTLENQLKASRMLLISRI